VTIPAFLWDKKGLIFSADEQHDFIKSHAQIPTVLVMTDRLRVYFSTRTIPGQSLTTFLDLDKADPKKVLYVHNQSIIELGGPGTFDEHGVMPSYVMYYNNAIYLYYSGWSKRCSVPYNNLTGLAISSDGGVTFNKVGKGPVLSSNIKEPFSATSPFVFEAKSQLHMYYCSGTAWHEINGKFEHVYDIKKAISEDGIQWIQNGESVIEQKDTLEAITRPTVFFRNNVYHMYYCYRGSQNFRAGIENSYKIGYAHSEDLVKWTRDDERSGILSSSSESWDSKMLAYPYLVETPKDVFLFYNGNGFGQSGFGYAVMNEL
jgi:hypothetical protein